MRENKSDFECGQKVFKWTETTLTNRVGLLTRLIAENYKTSCWTQRKCAPLGSVIIPPPPHLCRPLSPKIRLRMFRWNRSVIQRVGQLVLVCKKWLSRAQMFHTNGLYRISSSKIPLSAIEQEPKAAIWKTGWQLKSAVPTWKNN